MVKDYTNCGTSGSMGEPSATAFVPGHVTGFFSPVWEDDPDRSGATGAGITLSDGVTVTVERANDARIQFNDEPVSMGAVDRVLGEFGEAARVRAESPLPLGTGFGVSGAMALGAALGLNQVFEAGLSENEVIATAHRAEVNAGTGLGDVVAQARGGIPIRIDAGAPPHGTLDGIPTTATVEYLSFGELDTASVIKGDTDALVEAGEDALADLLDRPTLQRFVETSRRFSRETGLLTPQVNEAIGAVATAGGEALMAMLGDTVVAFGSGLRDAGYEAVRCSVHPGGATVMD